MLAFSFLDYATWERFASSPNQTTSSYGFLQPCTPALLLRTSLFSSNPSHVLVHAPLTTSTALPLRPHSSWAPRTQYCGAYDRGLPSKASWIPQVLFLLTGWRTLWLTYHLGHFRRPLDILTSVSPSCKKDKMVQSSLWEFEIMRSDLTCAQ